MYTSFIVNIYLLLLLLNYFLVDFVFCILSLSYYLQGVFFFVFFILAPFAWERFFLIYCLRKL